MPSVNQAAVKLLLILFFSASLQADITLVRLANEGVIVSDGESRVMIDGFVVEPYSVYGGLPAEAVPQFEQQTGIFAGIDVALASHRHHDHNQPRFACAFMQSSSDTLFYSGSQVIGLMREKCRPFVTGSPRINEISPQYGEPVGIEHNDVSIQVFPLSHGTRKYAKIQNYATLVDMGGMTVLHIGDAAMDPTDFARAGVDGMTLDIALIPFWYFQPGPGGALVEQYLNARYKLAVHIPPSEMAEVKDYLKADYPEVIVLENPLDEMRFSPPGPEHP